MPSRPVAPHAEPGATTSPYRWVPSAAAAGLVALAAVVRALPLLATNGVQASADFDEGVYLAASGLLTHGQVPYRDFALLHPPGVLLLAAPLTGLAPTVLSWSQELLVARVVGVCVGALDVLLLYLLGARWRGPLAGLVAAGLYAAYGPAVQTERHLLLEPFVVLFLLLGAWAWLVPAVSRRRALAAGALLAAGGLVKLTGGLALLALLGSLPVGHRALGRGRREGAHLGSWALAGAVGLSLLVLLPFVVLAGPRALWRDLVVAQSGRPGGDLDGGSIPDVPHRLAQAARLGPAGLYPRPAVVAVVLSAVLAASVWAAVRGERPGRFWSAALAALLVPPLLAPDWYEQYPVPAGAAACVLLGGATSQALARLWERRPSAGRVLAAAGALVLLIGIAGAGRSSWRERLPGSDTGAQIAERVGPSDCLFADPPDLALAADRLPTSDVSGSTLVDPFGALVLPGLEAGSDERTTTDLLRSDAAQQRFRAALSSCRFVALRREPERSPHMSPATVSWFQQRFHRVPGVGDRRSSLWQADDVRVPAR